MDPEQIKDENGLILEGGEIHPEENIFEELFENVSWKEV